MNASFLPDTRNHDRLISAAATKPAAIREAVLNVTGARLPRNTDEMNSSLTWLLTSVTDQDLSRILKRAA